MAKRVINAFNGGEVSPYLYARTDNELYDSSCIKMENFLPLEYGGATRRPALQYVSNDADRQVLIPFVVSTEDTFLCKFNKSGLVVIDKEGEVVQTFASEFTEDELYEIRYAQLRNKLFITHPNRNIFELIKNDDDFTFKELEFAHPPLLPINTTETVITTSSHNSDTTLTASKDFFVEDHVGAYMVFRSPRTFNNDTTPVSTSSVSKTFTYHSNIAISGTTDPINAADCNFTVETTGIWNGKVILQRSLGDDVFEDYVVIGDTTDNINQSGAQKNFTFSSTEEEPDNSVLRVKYIGGGATHNNATGCTASIVIENPYHFATVRITEYVSATQVNAEVISDFQYDINDFSIDFNAQSDTYNFSVGDRFRAVGDFDNLNFSASSGTVDMTDSAKIKLDASGSDLTSQWNTLTTVATVPNADTRTYKESQIVDATFGGGFLWILDKSAQVHKLRFNTTTSHEFDYLGIAFNVQSDFKATSHADMDIHQNNKANNSASGRLYNDNFITRTRVHAIAYDNRNSNYPIAILGGKDAIFNDNLNNRKAASSETVNWNAARSPLATYSPDSCPCLDSNAYALAKVHFYNTSGTKKAYVQNEGIRISRVVKQGLQFINEYESNLDHIEIAPSVWSEHTSYSARVGWVVPVSLYYQNNRLVVNYIDGKVSNYGTNWLNKFNAYNRIATVHKANLYRFPSFTSNTADLVHQKQFNGSRGRLQARENRTGETAHFQTSHSNAERDKAYNSVPQSLEPEPTTNKTNNIMFSSNIYKGAGNRIKLSNSMINNGTIEVDYNNIDNVAADTNISAMFSDDQFLYGIRSDQVIIKYEKPTIPNYYYVRKAFAKGTDTISQRDTAGFCVREFPKMKSWYEGAFSKHRGFPTDLAFYDGRLVFGGTKHEPNVLHLSRLDDFNNFLLGSTATHALRLGINSGSQNPIRWLMGARELVIGTDSNEWTLSSGSSSSALTPTQFSIKRRTQYGASKTNAVFVNSAVLFMMRQNKKLREWYLQENQEDYLAQDLSVIAEHITGQGIKQIAVQTQPTTVIWMVREDGTLIGLTYERESKTIAWHKHAIEGLVESVAVLPQEDGEDQVFVSSYIDNSMPTSNATVTYSLGTPSSITFTIDSHGFSNGDSVVLRNFFVGSDNRESHLNNKMYTVSDVSGNDFKLKDVNGNYLYTPIFEINSVGLNSDSASYAGKYVLTNGNGTIQDTTSVWSYYESSDTPTGEFRVSDGKWRFGVASNFSMALSSAPSTPQFPWNIDAWTNGTTGTSPFNNTAWGNGTAFSSVTANPHYVQKLEDEQGTTTRYLGKFGALENNYNLTNYKGLDFYREIDNNLDLDFDFNTVNDGTYTSNGLQGDWRINASSGGFVVVKGNQVRIHGSPNSENAQIVSFNSLTHGDKYKFTYTVDATLGESIMLGGKDPNNSHSTNTANTYVHLKSTTGTHNVTFTAHTAGASDGDTINFNLIRRGTTNGSDQTISNLKLEAVITEIEGLDAFNGKDIKIIENNQVTATKTVFDGKVTLDSEVSNPICYGLPFTSTLAPLYHSLEYRNGSTRGNKVSTQGATIRFKDTLSAKVGQAENAVERVKFDSTTSLNTEDAEVWLENANEFLQTTYIVQDEPFPCTVLAMIVDLEGTA